MTAELTHIRYVNFTLIWTTTLQKGKPHQPKEVLVG
jgi:hypothetical protein